MADIKNVISLICKQFKLLLDISIKPEHLRLAKFNKNEDDVVFILWQLLHKLIFHLENCNGPEVLYQEEGSESTVSAVKLYLFRLGYRNFAFYCLPSNMTSGSRELLIALAWLFASTDALDTLIFHRVMHSTLNSEWEKRSEELGLSSKLQHSAGSLEDELRYILWLTGRIKQNIKFIKGADVDRMQLTTRIHEATEGAGGLKHLSAWETKLVQNAQLQAQYLQNTKDDIHLLETYMKWRQKSSVFWQWMESVLKEKLDNQAVHATTESDKGNILLVLTAIRSELGIHLNCNGKCVMETEDGCVSSAREICGSLLSPFEVKGVKLNIPKFVHESKKPSKEMENWLSQLHSQLQEAKEHCAQNATNINSSMCKVYQQAKNLLVLFPKSSSSVDDDSKKKGIK